MKYYYIFRLNFKYLENILIYLLDILRVIIYLYCILNVNQTLNSNIILLHYNKRLYNILYSVGMSL